MNGFTIVRPNRPLKNSVGYAAGRFESEPFDFARQTSLRSGRTEVLFAPLRPEREVLVASLRSERTEVLFASLRSERTEGPCAALRPRPTEVLLEYPNLTVRPERSEVCRAKSKGVNFTVRPERSEVRRAKSKGANFTVRPERSEVCRAKSKGVNFTVRPERSEVCRAKSKGANQLCQQSAQETPVTKRRTPRLPAWALAAVLVLAALAGPAAAAERLLVFAAASLQGTVDDIGRRFEKAGGSRVAISFAASSTLARQIERGAAADVYLSASPRWTDRLEAGRWLRPGTLGSLLGNRLVLVAPAGQAAPVPIHRKFPLARLLGDGRLVMGDPTHVPAGQYARAALKTLGVWDAVAGRVAGTATVRHALALVGARRGALRHRLRHGRQGGARRRGGGGVPARVSSAHPLYRGRPGRQHPPAGRDLPQLPVVARRSGGVQGPRLRGPGAGTLMSAWTLSPAEIEALRLSVRVAAWSTLASLPLALLAAFVLARYRFWGKELLNGLPAHAAGAAAGGHRVPAAAAAGPAGRGRRMARTDLRRGVRVSLDRRRGGRGRGGVPADGAAHPAFPGGHRHAAGVRRQHPGRQPAVDPGSP